MSRIPEPVELVGAYIESTVINNESIAMGSTKYYNVDLVALLGAGVTQWGIAIAATSGTGGKATVTVYSSPKNLMAAGDPNSATQNDIVANAQSIVFKYPIQKQINFVAPKITIAVNSNGTIDLGGVQIIVWGIKGV